MDKNRFYIDPDTNERLRVTYGVELYQPICGARTAFLEVEATSEAEARQIALDSDLDWKTYDDDDGPAEVTISVVVDPENEDAAALPDNAVLVQWGYDTSGASLDALLVVE